VKGVIFEFRARANVGRFGVTTRHSQAKDHTKSDKDASKQANGAILPLQEEVIIR
jgi:hypothetical protein